MKVYVEPMLGRLSAPAMTRVTKALKRYAPPNLQFLDFHEDKPDFQVIHTIGANALDNVRAPRYAVIQYCWKTAGEVNWADFWARAGCVWSYYDLSAFCPGFYLAPLGVDQAFRDEPRAEIRDLGVVSSGYLTGDAAEPILEVADAALVSGLQVRHLGPEKVEGMDRRVESSWKSIHGINDAELARVYARSRWVSGLRYVEGFELPVIEGAACGARPIVFDRPETRQWFGHFASFIPECSGDRLVEVLTDLFRREPAPVPSERVKAHFNWEPIVTEFWKRCLAL